MKKWLSKFGPGLRLLAVFGIGAAGVTGVLPREQATAPEAEPDSRIQLVQAVPPPPPMPSRSRPAAVPAEIPWPWLDDLSQVELSEALLADLSRSEATLPRVKGTGLAVAVPPEPEPAVHPLAYSEPAPPPAVAPPFDDVLPPAGGSRVDVVGAAKARLIATAAASGY